MALIDFILNLAGLLLWLNWRAVPFDPLATATPATLVGTLRRTAPAGLRRWHFLAALGGLVLLRAFFYWLIGGAVDWTAKLDCIVITLSFRSDFLSRMILFSLLSFVAALGWFFLCLLLLSLLHFPGSDASGWHRFVRLHLARVDAFPRVVKGLLPLAVAGIGWWCLSWLLVRWELLPSPASAARRVEQASVLGLCSYLAWKHVIAGLLAVHLVNSYVYLGRHAVLKYFGELAGRLLQPLRWLPLRAGRVDFAPLLGIVVVLLLGALMEWGLVRLYSQLGR